MTFSISFNHFQFKIDLFQRNSAAGDVLLRQFGFRQRNGIKKVDKNLI